MSSLDPSTWTDRLLRACVSLLIASFAVYLAVHLIVTVLPWLIGIGTTVLVAWLVAALVRRRIGGW